LKPRLKSVFSATEMFSCVTFGTETSDGPDETVKVTDDPFFSDVPD
jgi:hypothetical protein